MPDIEETRLPGLGVRHEFTTAGGERVALLTHRTGRREIAVYDRDDPDLCHTVLHLSAEDVTALGELLAVSHVSETVRAAQRLEGVAIEWISVPAASPAAGSTIADGQFRARTGASIVAIIRDDSTLPAPDPETRLAGGDVVVAIGTADGLERLRDIVGG